jgi:uncharacterized protein
MRMLIKLLLLVILLYAGVCALLFFYQRSLIYHPTPEVAVEGVAHLYLDTGAARIKVWTLHPGQGKALLYFGGNAEQVAYNIERFAQLFPDRTVYLLNYRGYGGSSGKPTEQALYDDALLAFDYFSKKHRQLDVMGRSIGSAVATWVASKREVGQLVLITPFDSAVRIARAHYPWLPVNKLLRDRFDSFSRVGDIHARTLVIAAAEDGLVPRMGTEVLIEGLRRVPLQVAWLEGVDHNTIQRHPAYGSLLADFFAP